LDHLLDIILAMDFLGGLFTSHPARRIRARARCLLAGVSELRMQ